MSSFQSGSHLQPPVVETAASNIPAPSPPRRRRAQLTWANLCSCLPEFLRDRYERQYFFLVVMTSPVWRFFMCLCILLLLFGSHIQNLWCDKDYDMVFDVLYTIALTVFCLDIILRMLSVPGYAGFNCKPLYNRIGKFFGCLPRTSRHHHHYDDEPPLHIGSFLFWCDVISTLTLLYDISYINQKQREIRANDIQLDTYGIPTEGQINQDLPVENEVFLLATVGKTVRVVRFVRSSRVAKAVGMVNWYWPFQVLNPHNIRRHFCGEGSKTNTTNNNKNADNSEADGKKKSSDEKPKSPPNSDRSPPAFDNRAATINNQNGAGPPELMRRRSWGGLGMATLAAVKAHKLAKDEQEKQGRGVWGKVKRALWTVGILRNDKLEWQRQLAATKIQRAWRKVKQYDIPEKEEDFAWQDATTSLRKSPNSAAAAFRKRSIMEKHLSSNRHVAFRQSRKPTSHRSGVPAGDATAATANSAGILDKRRGNESQVGGAMRELTGQRVAIGIIVSLVLTVIFTYAEQDATRHSTMIVLHEQTSYPQFANASIDAARYSSIPDLFKYEFADNTTLEFDPLTGEDPHNLRNRETLRITVEDSYGGKTVGWFAYRDEKRSQAMGELFSTLFILLIWLFGVTAFAGPVMILVVLPIERMVRLLGMLMLDPLGYQSTSRYRKFVAEEDVLTKNTRWTKEVLKGMETSFLMSTILRIGSLMKVGFGSAGVEIIRQNLQRKQGANVNLLTTRGATVSCIFLFCDIRQFTDATECLQEEVFVFTNRIAAVVHSFCHSYGGSANKNIGDAFLCSWMLDDPDSGAGSGNRSSDNKDGLAAYNNQADKCLLCVVKICMSLHHDQYYVETMSEQARERLLAKLSKRPGPVVQMGCGLHAGKAVQGAIGSERKIDATYVSEAVEMAEFLESSTKKYGVNMLMSDSFHRLLHSSNRYRCRIVDQIVIQDDDDDEDEIYDENVMELYTYDINVDALWEVPAANEGQGTDNISDTESFNDRLGSRREAKANLSMRGKSGRDGNTKRRTGRRMSLTRLSGKSAPDVNVISDELKMDASATFALGGAGAGPQSTAHITTDKSEGVPFVKPELVLPTGPALYNANIWRSEVMLKIRQKYSDGLFFHKFNSGLQSFYSQDWDHAKQCFQGILDDCLDDGPSKYFLSQIEKHNGKPPPNFKPYGIA
ncbi:whole genome shotgun sequence [Seminavis robusta]|uniref:Whole genome shotgun sequence n=1 Tax=Seminavis robusta TaxID=568900 RepID=A0A9N8EFQ9_9STRA|nr:whole genome shotgun sequence [Seminavis robusta]|eukprot:Sro877_g214680.1 whole genome shotgun sequence (1175) ;mRNA; r:26972-30649